MELYFWAYVELEPMLSRGIYGGKWWHDDGLAGFEPRWLALGCYSNPLRPRRYTSAVENMRYISYIGIQSEFPKW